MMYIYRRSVTRALQSLRPSPASQLLHPRSSKAQKAFWLQASQRCNYASKPDLQHAPKSDGHTRRQTIAIGIAVALLASAAHAYSQEAHAEGPKPPPPKKLRLSEIRKHGRKSDSPWVIKGDRVYDITDWIAAHPGGNVILRAAGGNIDQYWQIFSNHNQEYVYDILEQFFIGEVDPKDLVDGKVPQESIEDPFEHDPQRDSRLKILSPRPCNAECVGDSLDSFLTPNEVFYVRNHLWVPDLKDDKAHKITVEHPDGEEVEYSVGDLQKKFKEHTITAVLQCSGNRRSEMSNAARPAQGLQWGIGAIGNAEWTGVLLRDVLKDSGFDVLEVPDEVRHVQFKGEEAYGASIPIAKAVDKLGDVLIAYKMNGKPLPRDHGFPVRVIVPGHVAARSVKWLDRITLSEEESTSQWQRRDYKCFGPNEGPKQADWDTAQAIQETPVQSAITKVTNTSAGDRPALEVYGMEEDSVSIEGYAYAGGGRRIVRVDVSANNGHTWDQAELLLPPEDAAAKGHKAWYWQRFRYAVPRSQVGRWLLVKAVDDSYNTQPEDHDPTWNFRGNLTTAWHKLKYERPE